MSDPKPELIDQEKPTNVRWIIFALSCGTSFVLYLHRYTWGMIKPYVQDEMDLDFAEMGWLDSAFSITYGVGQVPFGMLGDWFGPAIILGTIIGAWSITLGLTALAANYMSMLAVRFSFGAAQATPLSLVSGYSHTVSVYRYPVLLLNAFGTSPVISASCSALSN